MKLKYMKNLIELWDFLDADIPSKIFPEEMIRGQVFTRDDKQRLVIKYSPRLNREYCSFHCPISQRCKYINRYGVRTWKKTKWREDIGPFVMPVGVKP